MSCHLRLRFLRGFLGFPPESRGGLGGWVPRGGREARLFCGWAGLAWPGAGTYQLPCES